MDGLDGRGHGAAAGQSIGLEDAGGGGNTLGVFGQGGGVIVVEGDGLVGRRVLVLNNGKRGNYMLEGVVDLE
jgi:hypothetical protein